MPLFDCLNPAQVMHLVYYVLTERRIVIYGKRLGKVTSVIHALCAILYPFQWHVRSKSERTRHRYVFWGSKGLHTRHYPLVILLVGVPAST